MSARARVAVLISGRGSNLEALVQATLVEGYPAEIALVLSNRPDAAGLDLAARYGIEAICIDQRVYGVDRMAHEAAIQAALERRRIALVCLAGYKRLLTPFLVQRWRGRMLNIHPSLLPAFPGLDTHARALAAGVALHGCTVHLVTEVMDEGPILAQAAIPVLPEEREDGLAARVLLQEHRLYPAALRMVIEGAALQAPPDAVLVSLLPRLPHAP